VTASSGDVRWLDDDEQATWRALLLCQQLLDEALERQLRHDSGMAHSHYAILALLSEAPGAAMRMNELASVLRFSPSRMTHAISSLERKGWVTRRRCPDDGRGQHATLTGQGRAALEQAAPGHITEVRRRVFDRLSPTRQRQLRSICEAVLAGLDHQMPERILPSVDVRAARERRPAT
jgi:DNA-binding MarR family transcriptional regulator